jgi:hypothetical protein
MKKPSKTSCHTGDLPTVQLLTAVPQPDMTIETDTQTWTITGQLTCGVCSCLRVGRHDAGRWPGAGDQSIYRITGLIGTAKR